MSSSLSKRLRHGRQINEAEKRRLEEEFIIVGYACTIFRDDEKAEFVDEERHLINHPVDNSVTTDRYDGRLCIHDLESYDAANIVRSGNYDGREVDGEVDESELEFERYRDLMAADDYDEDSIQSGVYAAIGPPSDSPAGSHGSSPTIDDGNDQRSRRKEQQFVAPPELELPAGLLTPETMQMHAIMAKTAAFVATKGPQMEIVIKAKQKTKDNHFGFLDFDHALRPYYDHLLAMIRKGRYQYVDEEDSESDDEDGGDYLHPSLMISASNSAAKSKQPEPQRQQEAESWTTTGMDMMSILDRLAEYVARNGDAFEDIVRSRKDPLYAFIESSHEYNLHYRERVYYYRREYKRMSQAAAKPVVTQTAPIPAVSALKLDVSAHPIHRASTASPSLPSIKNEKSMKAHDRRHASFKRPSPSRRKIDHDDEFDRDSVRKKRKSTRHYKKSMSRSEDEDEDRKPRSSSKYASFVPLQPSKEKVNEDRQNQESSQGLDNVVKRTLGVEDDDKNEDSVKKRQEERRAKAKIFLKLIRDRDQASKIVNTGKPWEDD